MAVCQDPSDSGNVDAAIGTLLLDTGSVPKELESYYDNSEPSPQSTISSSHREHLIDEIYGQFFIDSSLSSPNSMLHAGDGSREQGYFSSVGSCRKKG